MVTRPAKHQPYVSAALRALQLAREPWCRVSDRAPTP